MTPGSNRLALRAGLAIPAWLGLVRISRPDPRSAAGCQCALLYPDCPCFSMSPFLYRSLCLAASSLSQVGARLPILLVAGPSLITYMSFRCLHHHLSLARSCLCACRAGPSPQAMKHPRSVHVSLKLLFLLFRRRRRRLCHHRLPSCLPRADSPLCVSRCLWPPS